MKARLLVAFIVVGCSGTRETVAPPPTTELAADGSITCCPPSTVPACCMQIGGLSYDGLCPLSCNVPDPNLDGWKLGADEVGCPMWTRPPGKTICTASTDAAADPCAPASVDGYVAAPLVPARPPQTACTSIEANTLYSACVGPQSSFAACADARKSMATCAQCAWSLRSDAAWGPLVASGFAVDLNVAGCVALVENDASASSCAARVAATAGCEAKACAQCPDDEGAALIAHETCIQNAAVGECRSFLDAECDLGDAGGAQCVVTDVASFVRFLNVFCNP